MKALVGSWETRPHRLVAEITSLRTKVRELERELELARQEVELLRRSAEEAPAMEVALTGS